MSAAAASVPQKPKCNKIPMTSHLFFDVVKLDGCKKKILEFNQSLNVFSEKDMIYFESLFKVLSSTATYHQSEVSPQQLEVIRKCLDFPIE